MLKRPSLSYHHNGHPVLSRSQIDLFATEFLAAYFPSNNIHPSRLSANDLFDLVERHDGVTHAIDDLGHDSLLKILGRIFLAKKHIILDSSLIGDRAISLPFVAAHEVAHWLLHRDCDIAAIRSNENLPDDDEETEQIDASLTTWTSLEWIEWQANKLAAALLIPTRAAINAIYALQGDMAINTRKGIIYKNSGVQGSIETHAQIIKIAALFGVSNTVARIRLKDLGLYHEQVPSKQQPDRMPQNPFSSIRALIKR